MAAASDQTYRNQKALDIVFGVSCVLMLVGTVWMFVQDFYREFKTVQRKFRDVEEAMSQREVLDLTPTPEKMIAVATAEKFVNQKRADLNRLQDQVRSQVTKLLPEKIKSEDKFRGIKAEYDSKVSFYDIAVEERNAATDKGGDYERRKQEVDELFKTITALKKDKERAQNEVDEAAWNLKQAQEPLQQAEQELSKAEDQLKELTSEFDRFYRKAERSRWGTGDWLRSLPILDGFASPLKIKQYTLDELTIDYAFKRVTRYDRCTTCHLAIEDERYQREALHALGGHESIEAEQKLSNARVMLRTRKMLSRDKNGLNPDDLELKKVELKHGEITQFCAHPRLDLFVDGNSAHPAEKFGCSICHAGQGSATDFVLAAHTPNDARQKHEWVKKRDWEASHFWDFPMLPNRFIESTCVKCHYQMTDLIREGSKVEAPKLLRGYNLVRDNGCFGCHEIAGIKGGRWVGPDLRLEPSPPLEAYTAAERAKMLSDPQNPPGTMRKVGPSLRRLSEKTNRDWLVKWVQSPRDFRPDTKMPHFYGLTNNDPHLEGVLPGVMKDFPDAEIHAIVYYLLDESKNYLKGKDVFRQTNEARKQELEDLAKKNLIGEKEKRELEEITRRLELTGKELEKNPPIAELLKDLPALPADEAAQKRQAERGRLLFSERGCLACHIHEGTEKPQGQAGKPGYLPSIHGEGQFGPNLSRIAAKLGIDPRDEKVNKESARRWLVQWIMNPNVHFPRTRMPILNLTLDEQKTTVADANDVAMWLLSQPTDWKGPDVPAPSRATLENLAKAYLERSYTQREVAEILDKGIGIERLKTIRPDAEERELPSPLSGPDAETKLKRYIGRKAIGQLGCFGCHDIPGFEFAKPIGTPLNEWGKKDPERLAFEDAIAFVKKSYHMVPSLTDKEGKPIGKDDKGKPTYEQFFFELLDHHKREGFLNQKLIDPRSYDYDRLRVWDERLRMPQFRFARAERRHEESDADFEARAWKEEAEAREAVMTFILGLVAEPIPPKYVYNAPPEKLAEVKGRQVLEKFNCAGCHLVRPAVYEFKMGRDSDRRDVTKMLDRAYDTAKSSFEDDHFFVDSNAWAGLPSTNPNRLTAYGVPALQVADDPKQPPIQLLGLTQAVRFTSKAEGKPQVLNLPAYSTLEIQPSTLISRTEVFGGTFGNLLVAFLAHKDPQQYPLDNRDDPYSDSNKARPLVPPALLREGEKTQPDWLFRFLKNPHEIRPVTVLRMPKFNMSDDDAMALVNYFSAADKMGDPAFGLTYPYFTIPERGEEYLRQETAEYVKRLEKDKKLYEARVKQLTPLWEAQTRTVLADAQARLKAAEARLKDAKEPGEKADAEKSRAAAQQDVARLQADIQKKDYVTARTQYLEKEAYLSDAYRLLSSDNVCLACHQVGNLEPKQRQGPPLNLAYERLRPEWTLRWLANPQRFMTYKTPMPQNFQRAHPQFQDLFPGTTTQQFTAVRDALMNYPMVIDMPANRQRPAVVAEAGGK